MIYIWNIPIVSNVFDIVSDLKMEVFASGLLREVKDVGSDVMITCPFHRGGKESKPSFGLSKGEVERHGVKYEAGTCHCYTCGYRSDLPTFISDLLGLENRIYGMKWLKERYLYGAGMARGELELDLDRDKPKEEGVLYSGVLVSHYHACLLGSDRAQRYLEGRKLLDFNILYKFGVGYDFEKDSIVFPVFDREGQVRLLKKRSVEGKKFDNTAGARKSDLVFGLYQLKVYGDRTKPVWICESETDALTVWCYGGQAIAQMGSHMSDKQLSEVGKVNKTMIDGLDRDEAGRKGWKDLKKMGIPLGFRFWNTKGFGEKKDINELTVQEFTNIELF